MAEQGRKRADQPGAEETEVLAGTGEDEGDGVAGGPGEDIAAARAVLPHVAVMWPITGSMPARCLISLRMVGVTQHCRPETNTRCL